MNRLLLLILLLAAPVAASAQSAVAPAPAEATYSPEHWAVFSQAVVQGLRADNDGVRASSLRHIATFGDRLDLGAATEDVARLYREADDEGMRLLALAALARLDGPWVTDVLAEHVRVEPSERVRRLTLAVMAERQRL